LYVRVAVTPSQVPAILMAQRPAGVWGRPGGETEYESDPLLYSTSVHYSPKEI
jgi:hypothetical protein